MALALPLTGPRPTERCPDPGWRATAAQSALEVELAAPAAAALAVPVRAAGRTARSLLDAVVLLVVLVFLALAVGPHLLDYRPVTMLTGSMAPAIPAGSVVLSTFVPPEAVRVGDVVTLQAPTGEREVVTHRVTDVERSRDAVHVRTQGDGNPQADPWTAELQGEVLRASATLPWVGYPLSRLQTPQASLVLTRVLPVTLLASLLLTVWRRPTRPRAAAAAR